MMVPGVDERDVDLHFRKSLARLKPGEPAADDHHRCRCDVLCMPVSNAVIIG
jgi:hypothetical protein